MILFVDCLGAIKRYFIIEKKVVLHFVHYSACLSNFSSMELK